MAGTPNIRRRRRPRLRWLLIDPDTGRLYAGRVVFAGVVGAVAALLAGLYGAPGSYHMPDRATAIEIGIKLATGVGALTAGLLAWDKLNLSHAEHVQRQRVHLDDRFNATIALLGHEDEAVRLGALYALESLINSDANRINQQQIVDVICAYLRYRTTKLDGYGTDTWNPTEVALPTDYRAAATIALRSPGHTTLNLSGTILNGHTIQRWLMECHFDGATLLGCSITGMKIYGCQFIRTTISRTTFIRAELDNCTFARSTLSSNHFVGTVLNNCRFEDSTVESCLFVGSTLIHTRFRRAHLNAVVFEESTLASVTLPERYSDDNLLKNAKRVVDLRWVDDSPGQHLDEDLEALHHNEMPGPGGMWTSGARGLLRRILVPHKARSRSQVNP